MSAAVLEGDERVNSVSVDGLVSLNRICFWEHSGQVYRRPPDRRPPSQFELDGGREYGPISLQGIGMRNLYYIRLTLGG